MRAVVNELSPEDKEILSGELIHKIKKMDPEIEKARVEESEHRLKEIEDGKVEAIPGDQVLAEARRRLREKI